MLACNFARNTPGRNFQAACARGQQRVCNGQCVPIMAANGLCRLDECSNASAPLGAQTGYCGGNLRCDPGAVPANDDRYMGLGRCSAVPDNAVSCDPLARRGTDANPCPGVSFCQTVGAVGAGGTLPPGICAERPNIPGPPRTAICNNPLEEGQSNCDGNWTDVLNPVAPRTICRPCGPGLSCDTGICRRSCAPQLQLPVPGTGIGACVQTAVGRSFVYGCVTQPGVNVPPECIRQSAHGASCPPRSSTETLRVAEVTGRRQVFGVVRPDQFTVEDFTSFSYRNGTPVCEDPRDECLSTSQGPIAGPTCCRPLRAACTVATDCCQHPVGGPFHALPGVNPPFRAITTICANSMCIEYDPCGFAGICAPLSACQRQFGAPAVDACVPCGRREGDACCPGGVGVLSCRPGFACSQRPGELRPACHGSACGLPGEPCCPNDSPFVCLAGSTCIGVINPTCQRCGAPGQPCCNGTGCNGDTTCDRNTDPPVCLANCDSCRRCALGQGFDEPCVGPGNGQCRRLSPPRCGVPGTP